MRPWLVQELCNATAQPLVAGSQQSSDGGDLAEFTDLAREATASYPWEDEPSSSVVCLKHQGWDIWAAVSYLNTQLTPPWLAARPPPRCYQRHFGRVREEAGCQNCPVFCERYPSVIPLP